MRRLFGGSRARPVAWSALVCIALMLVAVNIIAGRFLPARLDLTAEQLYTLSRGTRQTLAQIDEPITLRFYYSTRLGDALPGLRRLCRSGCASCSTSTSPRRTASSASKSTTRCRFPMPRTAPSPSGCRACRSTQQGEQVYFGLAGTNSTDDQQVIAFFAPERERFLEYDLTRLVHALAFPKRTVVGLISRCRSTATRWRADAGPAAAGRWRCSTSCASSTMSRRCRRDVDAIPASIDVLMLVHPQNLPDKTLFAIDQFVLSGGKALVFVDPVFGTAGGDAGRAERQRHRRQRSRAAVQGLGAAAAARTSSPATARDARRVGVPVPGARRAADGLRRLAQPARRRTSTATT